MFPAILPGACPDCPQPGMGGPTENRFTAFDSLCRGTACRDTGFPQVSVNTANLTLFVRVTDLVFGAPNNSFSIEQSFNMDDARSGPLGPGWTFNLGDSLTPDTDGSLLLRRGTGRIDRFATAPGSPTYFAVTNTRDGLTQSASGGYTLRSASSGTAWNFGADGKLLSIQDGALTRISLEYDSAGTLATARYRGRAIQFTFASNRLSKISDATGRSVTFTYSAGGQLASQTNVDGTTVAFEYDAAGNLKSITSAGGKYSFAYQGSAPNTSIASITLPDGSARQYDVPRTPSETRVTDGNGDATLHTSTAQGLLQSVRDAAGNTTSYTYDAAGNRTSVTNPSGDTTTFAYDGSGNLTSITDAGNNRWTADYAAGQLTRITDPRRNVWTLQYDGSGNLTGLADPLSGATAVTRSASGQITSVTNPASNKSTYQYGSDGLLSSFTDALGAKWVYTYDDAARIASRTDPAGNTVRAGYDSRNRIVSVSQDDVALPFDYSGLQRDALGRIAAYGDSSGNAIAYKYDAAGQLVTMTLPGGKTVSYTYDHSNRLSSVTDWAGNTALYRYDAAGYPLSVSISGGPVTVWQYDTARNLRAIVSTGPDGSPVAAYRYTVDAAGNRTAISSMEPYTDTISFPSYTVTYDAANRSVSRSDGQNYSYTPAGSLKAISGSRTAAAGYDLAGRLLSFNAEANVSWGYDSMGLRSTRNDRRYLWDLSGARPRLVMEADSSGAPVAWYIYGLGLLWKLTSDGVPYFYHFDGDGNVVAISNPVAGVVNQYRYDATGRLLASHESVENIFHARGETGWLDDGNGVLFTGSDFRIPELRLSLPSSADPSPPLPDLRPRLRGAGSCFFEGVDDCTFARRDR